MDAYRRTKATVVPVFIHGRNGLLFRIFGIISRSLQNLALFNELPKMQNRSLRITIGKPLLAETWSDISDDEQLINHFHNKVEALDQS